MTLIFRRTAWGIGTLALAFVSCGGDKSPTASTPSPLPAAAATPTPAPTPAPTPTPNPLGLAPGPVASLKAYLKTVESPTRGSGEFREVQKDADGVFRLYVGEYVVVDSTQRNADGQVCLWRKDPVYSWDNFDDMMGIKGSSDPFFFKFEVARPGYAEVTSKMDGVESNELKMRAVKR